VDEVIRIGEDGDEAPLVEEGRERDGWDSVFRDRDLVVYATPLAATLELLARHREVLPQQAVVTDLVSLKTPVLSRIRELGLADRYVGSHPMVGGTGTGFPYSRGDLYKGGRVWLVPGSDAAREPLERTRTLWAALGASPRQISATDHDRDMVWLSHLPQLVSNALVLTLEAAGYAREGLGSGGRDMTRLGGSGPDMWQELLEYAPSSLAEEALGGMVESLETIRAHLRDGDWAGIRELMNESRVWVEGRT
jgi:prephenate dehydrogenase